MQHFSGSKARWMDLNRVSSKTAWNCFLSWTLHSLSYKWEFYKGNRNKHKILCCARRDWYSVWCILHTGSTIPINFFFAVKLQLNYGNCCQGNRHSKVVCHSLPLCNNLGNLWWSPIQRLNRANITELLRTEEIRLCWATQVKAQ